MNTSFTVNNDIEFKTVEHHLRRLYNTADGQPCQYLLSSSFQKWLYNVRVYLRQQKKSKSMSTCGLFETYLPNYHVVFFDNEVSINFIKPAVPMNTKKTDNTNNTATTADDNFTLQKCKHKAKKQKLDTCEIRSKVTQGSSVKHI